MKVEVHHISINAGAARDLVRPSLYVATLHARQLLGATAARQHLAFEEVKEATPYLTTAEDIAGAPLSIAKQSCVRSRTCGTASTEPTLHSSL